MGKLNNVLNPFSLKGKNIVITGASSGIGRQCAISCCEMGARVALIGRREEKLQETVSLLSSNDNIYSAFDVTNYEDIDLVVAGIVSKIGYVDGFVHCAGIELTLPINVTKPHHYNDLFATNVIAAFEFVKVLSKKKYIAQQGGSFVFISSVMGFLGEIAHTAYCSSKGALIAGTKALALELACKNIRVNCISPAQIEDTEMTNKMLSGFSELNRLQKLEMHPLGYGTATDVANGCIYLLSDASKWVTGANLVIDGGYSAK